MEYHKINTVNFSDLKFSKSKKSSGLRFVIVYLNKNKVGLKLPSLRIPFDSKVNQFGQLEVNLCLNNEGALIEKLKELDECMLKFAEEHNWFEGIPKEEIKYTPMIKESANGNFPPTIKIKIPYKDNVVGTIFYDTDKTVISVDDQEAAAKLLSKNKRIQTAIECVGVWINNNKFGLSWKAEQIRFLKDAPPVPQEPEFDSDSEYSGMSDSELLIEE